MIVNFSSRSAKCATYSNIYPHCCCGQKIASSISVVEHDCGDNMKIVLKWIVQKFLNTEIASNSALCWLANKATNEISA